MTGWIKLHRSIQTHWIAQEPEALAVWIRLLMEANHSEVKKLFNGKLMTVKRGQLIFGLDAFSAKSGVSVMKLRRFLKLLEDDQMINRQRTNKFSLISIVNYDQYQEANRQTTGEQQADNKQTTSKQQHYKNGKNGEKEKKTDSTPYQAVLDSYHQRLPMLPRVRDLTDARKRHIKARWAKVVKDGKDETYFDRFFDHVSGSDFLTTGNFCNLEWLMKEGNHVKVTEGNYHND